VHLDFPSVGATENIMMAAACIKGTTKIHNAAKEPEVVDLQNFLNAAGAKIVGAGSDVITIKGVQSLGDVEYRPIPDRIISGTYLLASVICGGEIILKNTNPAHLGALIAKLDRATCKTYVHQNALIVKSNGRHSAISRVETLPYPGFPTDLQPQMVAMLATAKGSSLVIENLFETRFKYIQELCKMGADISVNGRSALIRGVPKLYGAEVYSNDLRGGAGLVLAGLMAEGYTKVDNIQQILRGYDNFAEDLSALGADITVV
ncbi:MAG: UDP-N-acetylglucosamine 1-carboxyvinyltransferase, partial [Clostridia bacterium]|nr:UDP-N-acetylglucosamine 1-carboxyvinyltransferase [Clostridia bacterium]